jgi:hypothetical protein
LDEGKATDAQEGIEAVDWLEEEGRGRALDGAHDKRFELAV